MLNRSDRYIALAGLMLLLSGAAVWQIGAPVDRAILDCFRLWVDSPFAQAVAIFSRLGGLAILAPAALVVVVALALRGRRYEATWLFTTIATGRAVIEAAKELLGRARPPIEDHLAVVTSHSFPSSHSAGSMLTGLALASVLAPGSGAWRAFAMTFACAIGASRIALGVHWPSDVIAGLGFGMVWTGLAACARRPHSAAHP